MYKQIGPVLVKQDVAEAKSNVDTRLEFIAGEMFVFVRCSGNFSDAFQVNA